jgi:hypothetical protein
VDELKRELDAAAAVLWFKVVWLIADQPSAQPAWAYTYIRTDAQAALE